VSAVAGTAGTRERLLAAARELIEEGGYAGAPVVAIAGRAGVAAGTLYRHFASKSELFLEVFRSVCAGEERAMMAAADAVPAQEGAVGRLEAVLTTFAQRALQNPRLAWALLAEPVDQLVDAERLAYRERYAEMVARELREAIRAGEIPEQDVAFMAAALVGGCGEALVGPLSPVAGARPASGDVVPAIQSFVRRAIGAA
jgi:AcrR family transcriptional regulator